jgi:hypothetical protein
MTWDNTGDKTMILTGLRNRSVCATCFVHLTQFMAADIEIREHPVRDSWPRLSEGMRKMLAVLDIVDEVVTRVKSPHAKQAFSFLSKSGSCTRYRPFNLLQTECQTIL